MKPNIRASIIITLAWVYTGALALNILLNPLNELSYTHFTLFLALPTGIPLLSVMTLFKKNKVRMIVGILMISFVALVDLGYALWLLSSFKMHESEFIEAGLFNFVLLVIFTFVRVVISTVIVVFLGKLIGVNFEERFNLKKNL